MVKAKQTVTAGVAAWLLVALATPGRLGAEGDPSSDLAAELAVRGGLRVIVGCEDVDAVVKLAGERGTVLQALDADEAKVRRAREALRAAGLYGRSSADTWAGDRLPYADNTVRRVFVAPGYSAPGEEILRVLCPRGVGVVAQAGKPPTLVRKPRPEAMDVWTHDQYDPTGHTVSRDRLVAPPTSFQWIGEPKYTRQHEAMSSFNACVTDGERVFAIIDEGPAAAVEAPAKWRLVARDAFSGVTLWKREIPRWLTHYWPWKSGPSNMPRKLVSVGGEVYLPLAIDADVAALDAATGKTLRTYAGSATAEELIVTDSAVLVVRDPDPQDPAEVEKRYLALRHQNKRFDSPRGKIKTDHRKARQVVAYDRATGARRWAVDSPVLSMTLACKDGQVVWHDGTKLRCVSLTAGEDLWSVATPNNTSTYWTEVTPTLAIHENLVLYAWSGTVSAHSLDDGRKLWSGRFSELDYASPASCYVVDGMLWQINVVHKREKSEMIGYDPRTGREEARFARPRAFGLAHHRCHKTVATERFVLAAAFGVEFIDPNRQSYTDHNWVRGACLYGFMPANGLLYIAPHSCACNVQEKVNGYFALSGSERPPGARPADPPSERTVKGTAFGDIEASAPLDDDWPTYRGDAARSACSPTTLPGEPRTVWTTDPGGKVTPPTVAGGAVLVAQPEELRVVCLDADDGDERWRVTTPSRVDSPPTVHAGTAIFGCADGWVYCRRLTDGELVWKTRLAPIDRRLVVRDRLESCWPVTGSVLVRDGVVFAAAGRSSYLDGGMVLARLDATGGAVLSRTDLSAEALTPKGQDVGHGYYVGTLQDVLVAEGETVFLRHVAFDAQGQIASRRGAHLHAAGGMLDRSWHYRHYWTYSPFEQGRYTGYRNWHSFGEEYPSGRILAVGPGGVYGFGRDRFPGRNAHQFVTGEAYHLFRAPKRGKGKATRRHDWLVKPPFHGFALLLANVEHDQERRPVVVMAGPEGDTLRTPEAWAGETGGRLLIADRATGEVLSRVETGDLVPVIDGMAAAGGRLYMATKSGAVACLAGATQRIDASQRAARRDGSSRSRTSPKDPS